VHSLTLCCVYIHVKHGNLSSTLEKFKGISKYFDNVEHPFVQKRQSRKVDVGKHKT